MLKNIYTFIIIVALTLVQQEVLCQSNSNTINVYADFAKIKTYNKLISEANAFRVKRLKNTKLSATVLIASAALAGSALYYTSKLRDEDNGLSNFLDEEIGIPMVVGSVLSGFGAYMYWTKRSPYYRNEETKKIKEAQSLFPNINSN